MDDSVVLRKRGYTLGISLGEGSSAKVKSAYSERLKRNVAVKIINRRTGQFDFLEKFLPRELDILASLNHPNIVKAYEMFETTHGKVYMIMEIGVHGDLLEFIKLRGALPEDFCGKLFRQLSQAIKFVHDLNVAHRDLKCENLLLDMDFNLKVSDFGFSKRLSYDDDGKLILSRTFCGSAVYAPPEVLQGVPYNPQISDVWSMGVVLFIMLCGSMPYDDSNIKKMLKIQQAHRVDFPSKKTVPTECKDLICRMLDPDVTRRIQINDILGHAWLQVKSKGNDGSKRQQGGPSTPKACSKTRLDGPSTSKACSKTRLDGPSTSKACSKTRLDGPSTSKACAKTQLDGPSTPKACSKTRLDGPSTPKACSKCKDESMHLHGNENGKGAKAEVKSDPKPVENRGAGTTTDARRDTPADS